MHEPARWNKLNRPSAASRCPSCCPSLPSWKRNPTRPSPPRKGSASVGIPKMMKTSSTNHGYHAHSDEGQGEEHPDDRIKHTFLHARLRQHPKHGEPDACELIGEHG